MTCAVVLLVARCGAAQAPAANTAVPGASEATVRLQLAAMNGDLAQVAAAVRERQPLDAPGDSRMTALGIAALYGRAEVITALAAAGADVSADQDGESALAVAAHEGHVAAVEALLAAGARLDVTDKDGITPLMVAASSNRAAVIRALLAKGAPIDATNNDGATALVAAAYGGHAQATEALLAGGANTSVRDKAGRTALMASALGGNAAVTRLLLDRKADAQVDDNNGMNALVYAASTGQDEIVALLQKAGVTKGSDMALAFAVRGCRIPLATSLLTSGASLKAELGGDHLLILAAGANCPSAIELLLSRGMDVNVANEDGMTALMRAAGEGYADIVALLLSKGADMELQNAKNQSAWLFAAMGNHNEVVELLRADREARAKKGRGRSSGGAGGSRFASSPLAVRGGADVTSRSGRGVTGSAGAAAGTGAETAAGFVARLTRRGGALFGSFTSCVTFSPFPIITPNVFRAFPARSSTSCAPMGSESASGVAPRDSPSMKTSAPAGMLVSSSVPRPVSTNWSSWRAAPSVPLAPTITASRAKAPASRQFHHHRRPGRSSIVAVQASSGTRRSPVASCPADGVVRRWRGAAEAPPRFAATGAAIASTSGISGRVWAVCAATSCRGGVAGEGSRSWGVGSTTGVATRSAFAAGRAPLASTARSRDTKAARAAGSAIDPAWASTGANASLASAAVAKGRSGPTCSARASHPRTPAGSGSNPPCADMAVVAASTSAIRDGNSSSLIGRPSTSAIATRPSCRTSVRASRFVVGAPGGRAMRSSLQ